MACSQPTVVFADATVSCGKVDGRHHRGEVEMILTAHPSAYEQKRDLHVGGLGAHSAPTLAAIADPVHTVADSWLERAKDVAEVADDVVRDNPWAAVAVVGALGLALGWFLAQRD